MRAHRPGTGSSRTTVEARGTGHRLCPDATVLMALQRGSCGDFGAVRLRRGPDVLITAQTQDFRTLDQHFVSPIIY